jgi:ABC-type branched-subunit amino acid transport system substrate-binding protein
MRIHRSTFFAGFFILLFLCFPLILHAQDFDQGLSYYQNKEYQEAVSVFKNLSSDRANLFLGKSHYALGQYQKALKDLSRIPRDTLSQIYLEAKYTTALANYQQKKFGTALNKLFELSESSSGMTGNLSSNAKRLYGQILHYLTARQREEIMVGRYDNEVKFDLLKSALGTVSFTKAGDLYHTFTQNVKDEQWLGKAREFHSNLSSKSSYHSEYGFPSETLRPPKGTIYHIGIVMPGYKPNSSNYGVVRALYLGAVLAADQYNQKHQRTKITIHFVNTEGSAKNMKAAVKQFVSKGSGDVLIGPLFSRQVQPMISLTSELHIPAVAPLANRNVDLQDTWVYQANPTYKIQGKEMAKYAVNELNINRFTVIADENTRGAAAAQSFRKEAKKLDAVIDHYFVRNLGSSYEFSKYTRYFGASTPPIKAVYAPLNSSNALTLIDLLLRKIRTVHHHVTVLGAQEWEKHHFQEGENKNIDIYYSASNQPKDSYQLDQFKNKYSSAFNSTGNEYSIIGYDVTRFILKTLQNAGNPDLLKSKLASQSKYNGLARDIYFDGTHVNHAIHIVHAPGR